MTQTHIKPGIYITVYGNAAKVTRALAARNLAKDLDMGETIPLSEVDLTRYVRRIEVTD